MNDVIDTVQRGVKFLFDLGPVKGGVLVLALIFAAWLGHRVMHP